MIGKLKAMLISLCGHKAYFKLKKLLDRWIFKYNLETYSQFGEDLFLREYFKDRRDGFFVDVGAYHPRQKSNTYWLYKNLGWHGINVDATPGFSTLFKQVRPRDISVEAAVSDTRETLFFHSWGDHPENTLNPAQVNAMTEIHGQSMEKIEIETQPLKSIMADNGLSDQPVDLMTVDVEGQDLKVLHSWDWSKQKPKVVIVEFFAKTMSEVAASDISAFMESRNYRLAAWYNPSLIFEHIG